MVSFFNLKKIKMVNWLITTFNSSASIPGGWGVKSFYIQGEFRKLNNHMSKYHLHHRNGQHDRVVRPEFKPNVTFFIVD